MIHRLSLLSPCECSCWARQSKLQWNLGRRRRHLGFSVAMMNHLTFFPAFLRFRLRLVLLILLQLDFLKCHQCAGLNWLLLALINSVKNGTPPVQNADISWFDVGVLCYLFIFFLTFCSRGSARQLLAPFPTTRWGKKMARLNSILVTSCGGHRCSHYPSLHFGDAFSRMGGSGGKRGGGGRGGGGAGGTQPLGDG